MDKFNNSFIFYTFYMRYKEYLQVKKTTVLKRTDGFFNLFSWNLYRSLHLNIWLTFCFSFQLLHFLSSTMGGETFLYEVLNLISFWRWLGLFVKENESKVQNKKKWNICSFFQKTLQNQQLFTKHIHKSLLLHFCTEHCLYWWRDPCDPRM